MPHLWHPLGALVRAFWLSLPWIGLVGTSVAIGRADSWLSISLLIPLLLLNLRWILRDLASHLNRS